MNRHQLSILAEVDRKAAMVKHACDRYDKTAKMDDAGLQSLYGLFNAAVENALDTSNFPPAASDRVRKVATMVDDILLKTSGTVQLALR